MYLKWIKCSVSLLAPCILHSVVDRGICLVLCNIIPRYLYSDVTLKIYSWVNVFNTACLIYFRNWCDLKRFLWKLPNYCSTSGYNFKQTEYIYPLSHLPLFQVREEGFLLIPSFTVNSTTRWTPQEHMNLPVYQGQYTVCLLRWQKLSKGLLHHLLPHPL